MGKKPIVTGVIGAILVVLVVVVLVCLAPPAITVHYVRSNRSGHSVRASFQITNHTSNRYFVFPRLVEALEGAKWNPCFEFTDPSETELRPFGYNSLTVEMTNRPSGSRLRMSLAVVKELRGIKGFPGMLRLKFMDGVADVPLNPFDKYIAIGSHEISIVSDEFVEAEPK